jgi:membrane-associated protein
MELLAQVIDIFVHLDRYISPVIQHFGLWTYVIFFLVIFCETGLVVTPFLPGDSLLFALGTFAARGDLEILWLVILLSVAAILGNVVNYAIGSLVGPRIFHKEDVRFLNRAYLDKTHAFYERHGAITIVIARFLPIIRTFAPFVAGIGRMTYWRFSLYNAIGSLAWILLFTLGGYYFGNIPFVKRNFSLVMLVIIIISVLPSVIAYLRQRPQAPPERKATP